MCTPATMLVGGLGMGAAQMYMGQQAGAAQAANAQAAAYAGYAGAVEQYNQQVGYLNEVDQYNANWYLQQTQDRQEVVEYYIDRYKQTGEAAAADYGNKLEALQTGILQFQEATMHSMQNMWQGYAKAQSTEDVRRASSGVEGRSHDDARADAARAMYVADAAAIEQMKWQAQQAGREAQAAEAQANSIINAATPPPIAHVQPPAPLSFPNAPTWAPYGIQAQAGAIQGQTTTTNAILGGIGTGLGSFGNYYTQTTP